VNEPSLTETPVIANGGWHPRYARDLAIATDGDWGLAIVDGNGDGAELEAASWNYNGDTWTPSSSSWAGPPDLTTPRIQGDGADYGETSTSQFAHGVAPQHDHITISFNGHEHQVPVSSHGVWAFVEATNPDDNPGPPTWSLTRT
jgi:hypothetical protein